MKDEIIMNEYLSKMSSEFAGIKTMQADISRLHSLLESPALDFARQANLAISQISSLSQIGESIRENTKFLKLWKLSIQPFNDSELALQAHLAKLSEFALLAQKSFAQIPFQNIGKLIDLSEID